MSANKDKMESIQGIYYPLELPLMMATKTNFKSFASLREVLAGSLSQENIPDDSVLDHFNYLWLFIYFPELGGEATAYA